MAGIRSTGLRAIALGLILFLVACTPLYRNHGYVPTDEELAALTVGRDTRETVAEAVGRPSAQGLLNDEAWYYVQSRWQQQGLARRTEIDRQVVAISFNQAGTVTNIERFGLEDGQVVALSRRVTEENVQGRSALAQIFANFGRLDVGQILADQ